MTFAPLPAAQPDNPSPGQAQGPAPFGTKGSSVPGSLVVTCMRNEGSSVLEWFAFHRVIGFENFLIYTNDCQDGTDAIWDRLAAMGMAVHRDNTEASPFLGPAQKRAIQRLVHDPVYRTCTWTIFLDADEFVNVTDGDGTLAHLLSRNAASDCIFLNWRVFGSSGRERFEPGLLTEQYTFAHQPGTGSDALLLQSPKAIYRREAFNRPGIHRPVPLADEPDKTYTRPSGRVCGRRWAHVCRRAEYGVAQINHYAVQSLESLMLKVHRGNGAKQNRHDAAFYVSVLDHNDAADLSIQRHLPAVRAELETLLADPILNRLHRQAIDWRLGEIRRIFADEAVRDEFAALPRLMATA